MKHFWKTWSAALALVAIVAMLISDCAGGATEQNVGIITERSMQEGYWEHHQAQYTTDAKGNQTLTAAAYDEYHPPQYYVGLEFADDKPTTVAVTEQQYNRAVRGQRVRYRCRRGRWSGTRWLESYTE